MPLLCDITSVERGRCPSRRTYNHELTVPKILTIFLLPSCAPELNPVENICRYLRQTWLSNHVFETYDDIIDAGCDAWNRLIAQPHTIMSIGMRNWAHIGH